jgi:hypothetical protein
MNVNTGALRRLFLGVLMLVGACGGGSKPPPGSPCLKNTDCTNPLSCSYGACHVTCTAARDCPTGQDCIKAATGNVCQLPSESHCNYRSDCMSPLVCALDRTCRSQCKADIDCPTSTQKCVAPDMVCAEPAEIDSTTNLLKSAQSTPVPDAPPDAGTADGAVAGSGGSGASGSGGAGGLAGGEGAPDASAAGTGDAGVDAVVCGNDLSNVGTGDFTISLTLTTTAMNSAGPVGKNIGLTALINQHSTCNLSAPQWNIRVGLPPTGSPANAFWIGIETVDDTKVDDSVDNFVVLNDGVPHMIVVTRISGMMRISVDGVAGTPVLSTSNFGALPHLAIGTDVCDGVDGTVPLVGTVTNVCISH